MKDCPKILYQDQWYVAAHKPAWWLTHPSDEARQIKDNLMSAVRDLIGEYVYPVNRLDLQVSGIVLFARQKEAVTRQQNIWNTDQTIKKYQGLVHGQLWESGRFDFPLQNDAKIPKESLTLYKIINTFDEATFVEIQIKTGRRHQIRRHFSRRMHALIGDRKYGKKKWNDPYLDKYALDRIFLHCHYLKFFHPYIEQSVEITNPLPKQLQQIITDLIAK
jgi:tRNA pseudouridine65 synthase